MGMYGGGVWLIRCKSYGQYYVSLANSSSCSSSHCVCSLWYLHYHHHHYDYYYYYIVTVDVLVAFPIIILGMVWPTFCFLFWLDSDTNNCTIDGIIVMINCIVTFILDIWAWIHAKIMHHTHYIAHNLPYTFRLETDRCNCFFCVHTNIWMRFTIYSSKVYWLDQLIVRHILVFHIS